MQREGGAECPDVPQGKEEGGGREERPGWIQDGGSGGPEERLCRIGSRCGQKGAPEEQEDVRVPNRGAAPVAVETGARPPPPAMAAPRKRSRQQAWPEEEGDREHGLYSLHRMFDIVGTHLTHRDVRVLSFLFVDVIDDYERGMIRSGRDFLLALERQGRCDETNFRQVLQLLRIITRHDLLPYVTLKRRKAVCPDLVDKYLEETSIRYVTPRAHSGAEQVPAHQHKSVPAHHPLVCCSSSGPQICPKRSGRGRALLSNQRKRRKSVTPDPKDKQTCDIRLRVRAEYCQHETALEGNVFSNKQDPLERQFERFSQANTILKSRDLGSIICDIKFSELTYLDAFWRDYINGSLLEALKGVFITDSLKQAVGHEAIKLLVNVDEEDYEVGRQKLLRNLMLQTAP
ncbi:death effector domain-containing protein isoform X1 [Anolis carolinensis]|nr:PREDICTED: death effector domain-containing protein [Anolis carolinensis]|eukprot:XP_008122491.1 PREDICTED: death effector domain-containing protein [Anolis carolinensis]